MTRAKRGLSLDERARQQARALPDREALSTFTLGHVLSHIANGTSVGGFANGNSLSAGGNTLAAGNVSTGSVGVGTGNITLNT